MPGPRYTEVITTWALYIFKGVFSVMEMTDLHREVRNQHSYVLRSRLYRSFGSAEKET